MNVYVLKYIHQKRWIAREYRYIDTCFTPPVSLFLFFLKNTYIRHGGLRDCHRETGGVKYVSIYLCSLSLSLSLALSLALSLSLYGTVSLCLYLYSSLAMHRSFAEMTYTDKAPCNEIKWGGGANTACVKKRCIAS